MPAKEICVGPLEAEARQGAHCPAGMTQPEPLVRQLEAAPPPSPRGTSPEEGGSHLVGVGWRCSVAPVEAAEEEEEVRGFSARGPPIL